MLECVTLFTSVGINQSTGALCQPNNECGQKVIGGRQLPTPDRLHYCSSSLMGKKGDLGVVILSVSLSLCLSISLSLCLSVLLSHFLSKPANKFWNLTKQRLSSLNAKLVRTCQPNPLMKYRKKWLLYQGHFTSFAALRWLPF